MTNITWELDLQCTNCKAQIHLASDLGDTFKLSRDYKRERLLKEAEVWISNHPWKGSPYPNTPPYVELHSIQSKSYQAFDVLPCYSTEEVQTRFVKCPICHSRIYIC